MPSALRAWIAGLALAISAFLLTLASPPERLAKTAGVALFVVFANAWVIAVAERACPFRGGLRVARFPLGPRLLRAHPGVLGQTLTLAAVLGLVMQSPSILGWALLIVAVLSVQKLRSMAWYVVPALAVVQTLLTMPEFHTLGDLVADARGWTIALVTFVVQSFVVGGPLLRSDVGAPLTPAARGVVLAASLPGYAAAFWVFSVGPLAGVMKGLEALAVTLLVGGLLQSALLASLSWAIAFKDRDASGLPPASAQAVGRALLPLLLAPAAAGAALLLLPGWLSETRLAELGGGSDGFQGVPAGTWLGLMALLLIVPAVAGAGLVGAALDRVDGPRGGRAAGAVGFSVAGAALAVWFVWGPAVVGWAYAPEGLAAGLRETFVALSEGSATIASTAKSSGTGSVLVAPAAPAAQLSAALPGADVHLFGVAIADFCRALTLMIALAAVLAARAVRHAAPLQLPIGVATLALLPLLQVGASCVLVPALGPAGAPLAGAAGCLVLLLLDARHKKILPIVPPSEPVDESVFTSDELFGKAAPLASIR